MLAGDQAPYRTTHARQIRRCGPHEVKYLVLQFGSWTCPNNITPGKNLLLRNLRAYCRGPIQGRLTSTEPELHEYIVHYSSYCKFHIVKKK